MKAAIATGVPAAVLTSPQSVLDDDEVEALASEFPMGVHRAAVADRSPESVAPLLVRWAAAQAATET